MSSRYVDSERRDRLGRRLARRCLQLARELTERLVRERHSGWPSDGVVRLGPDETSTVAVPPGRLEIDCDRQVMAYHLEDQVPDAQGEHVREPRGPFSVDLESEIYDS